MKGPPRLHCPRTKPVSGPPWCTRAKQHGRFGGFSTGSAAGDLRQHCACAAPGLPARRAQTPLFPTLHTQSDAWLPKFCSWAPLLPADIQGDGNSAVIESCSQSARALLRMPYAAFISAMMHNGQVRLWFDALLQGLPRKVDKRRARLMGPAAALANVRAAFRC